MALGKDHRVEGRCSRSGMTGCSVRRRLADCASQATACAAFPSTAYVLDAVGLYLAGVDRCLLINFADTGQVSKEIGSADERVAVKPDVELAHDVLAGMQTLLFRPGPAV